MHHYAEHFTHFLEGKGLHTTRQRLAIAELLHETPGHHSIEELYDILRETEPGIGQATVYRTVKLLMEAGLLAEMHFADGVSRFEVIHPQSAHDHLICRACGAVVEINSKKLSAAQIEVALEHGFILSDLTRCLYGLCAECRAAGAAGTQPAFRQPELSHAARHG
ncbi:transcriptional repressor [Desulfovibrio sp. OttesenSCG-928-I05]|nr:transcriptional repressor [Desulfovibrio sp. OttesenSCG-928-I05]